MSYNPKLQLRRRIAKTCFAIIVLTVIGCVLFVIFGDSEQRENLEATAGIIMAVLLFSTSIIGGYMCN
jgi:hypothetical protein